MCRWWQLTSYSQSLTIYSTVCQSNWILNFSCNDFGMFSLWCVNISPSLEFDRTWVWSHQYTFTLCKRILNMPKYGICQHISKCVCDTTAKFLSIQMTVITGKIMRSDLVVHEGRFTGIMTTLSWHFEFQSLKNSVVKLSFLAVSCRSFSIEVFTH